MKWALIRDGQVDCISLCRPMLSSDNPDPSFVEVADQVFGGWRVNEGSFLPPLADAPRLEDVTAERDRRINKQFVFNSKLVDFDEASKQRMTGAATLAGFAIMEGAKVGNLFWHGGAQPFAWISADNTVMAMDAQTVFAMGKAAAAWETAHIFAARALKELNPIPEDFSKDDYWPAASG